MSNINKKWSEAYWKVPTAQDYSKNIKLLVISSFLSKVKAVHLYHFTSTIILIADSSFTSLNLFFTEVFSIQDIPTSQG